jgi:hypothetical protein
MRQLTRRALIGQALLAGVGASVAGAEARSARGAIGLEPDPRTGYDPGFLMGTVVATSSSAIYEVADENGVVQTIDIATPAAVWKQGSQGGVPIAVGDRSLPAERATAPQCCTSHQPGSTSRA